MKILNLYAGIGGNRKLWGDEHDITAVEYKEDIATLYQKYYPKDTVVIGDAHKYLLGHYKEFDFIWSSPPCPSHSDIRRCGVHRGIFDAIYPDMALWQEIIFLQNFCSGVFCVENVKPYYKPLIMQSVKLDRHLFWTNFHVPKNVNFSEREVSNTDKFKATSTNFGFNLTGESFKGAEKVKILRNLVHPEVGLHILNSALGTINTERLDNKVMQLYFPA